MSEVLSSRELAILRGAMRDSDDGHTYLNASDGSAAARLQERGYGRWEQSSPFVASFYINDAGRAAALNPGTPGEHGRRKP